MILNYRTLLLTVINFSLPVTTLIVLELRQFLPALHLNVLLQIMNLKTLMSTKFRVKFRKRILLL